MSSGGERAVQRSSSNNTSSPTTTAASIASKAPISSVETETSIARVKVLEVTSEILEGIESLRRRKSSSSNNTTTNSHPTPLDHLHEEAEEDRELWQREASRCTSDAKFHRIARNLLRMGLEAENRVAGSGGDKKASSGTPASQDFLRQDAFFFYYKRLNFVGALNIDEILQAELKFNILIESVSFEPLNGTETSADVGNDPVEKPCDVKEPHAPRSEFVLIIPRTSSFENNNIQIIEQFNEKEICDAIIFESDMRNIIKILLSPSMRNIGIVFEKNKQIINYSSNNTSRFIMIVLNSPLSNEIMAIKECLVYLNSILHSASMRESLPNVQDLQDSLNLDLRLFLLQPKDLAAKTQEISEANFDAKSWKSPSAKKKDNSKNTIWKVMPIRNGFYEVNHMIPKLIGITVTYSHPSIKLQMINDGKCCLMRSSLGHSPQNDTTPIRVPIKILLMNEELIDKAKNIYSLTVISQFNPTTSASIKDLETLFYSNQMSKNPAYNMILTVTKHFAFTNVDRSSFITLELPIKLYPSDEVISDQRWWESLNHETRKLIKIPLFRNFNGLKMIYSIRQDILTQFSRKTNGLVKRYTIDRQELMALDRLGTTKSFQMTAPAETTQEIEVWLDLCYQWKKACVNSGRHESNLDINDVPRKMHEILRGAIFTNKIGIPNSLRVMIWQLLLQSSSKSLNDIIDSSQLLVYYNKFMTYASFSQKYDSIIHLDCQRTIMTKLDNQSEEEFVKQMGNIVKAFSVIDPDVGYFQGFTFIVATLLRVLPEEIAFHMFVVIMNNYNLRKLFLDTKDFSALSICFYTLTRLIQIFLPHVKQKFDAIQMDVKLFAVSWFMTLFTVRFPHQFSLVVLDLFLYYGMNIIYSISLSLINFVSKITSEHADFEEFQDTIMNVLPQKVGEQLYLVSIIKDAFSFSVTNKQLYDFEDEFLDLQMTNYITNDDPNYKILSKSTNKSSSYCDMSVLFHTSDPSENCISTQFYKSCLDKLQLINNVLAADSTSQAAENIKNEDKDKAQEN